MPPMEEERWEVLNRMAVGGLTGKVRFKNVLKEVRE